MPFNLIQEPWIPVRRKSNKHIKIRPSQITEDYETDPIVVIDAPRADFNGAITQFLIGLIQTTLSPQNSKEWRNRFDRPPKPSDLQVNVESVAHAFNLDGDGPRFMQESNLEDGKKNGIYSLLIEAPGEQTIRDNTDHFIKRGAVGSLCPPCAAAALLTLQTNAPKGGQGHYTSIRGGGPLTTLLLGETLWQTIWLNVLEEKDLFGGRESAEEVTEAERFVWLNPSLFTRSGTGRDITPEDTHPLHVFWAMPRRIWLVFDSGITTPCDLCGDHNPPYATHFFTKIHGIHYKTDIWLHPLSPYKIGRDGSRSAVHARPGGISYRHWLGLVLADRKEGEAQARVPSKLVDLFLQNKDRRTRQDLRMWAFGYNMDDMKARCWYDSTMPLLLVSPDILKEYEYHVANLIKTSQQVAANLYKCIKTAIFKRPESVKGDFSFIGDYFWQITEPFYYETLSALQKALSENEDPIPFKHAWLKSLTNAAEKIFDELSQTNYLDTANPHRIAEAWHNLRRFNSIRNKKIQKLLGLPDE